MEYLSNTDLLMFVFGLIMLTVTYFAYKGIAKSKGLPDNPIVDETFRNTAEILKDKIEEEIQETKQEIDKKKLEEENQKRLQENDKNIEKAPIVPPSDLVIPMPAVKKPREPRKKKEVKIEENEDESDSGINPI